MNMVSDANSMVLVDAIDDSYNADAALLTGGESVAVRLISRHASEMSLLAIGALERFLPGSGEAAIVALIILRICLPDWTNDDQAAPPATLHQSTSIHAVAVSLGWPYATVHRLVLRLIKRGVLVRVAKGVAFDNTGTAAATVAFLHDASDIMMDLVENLHAGKQLDAAVYVANRRPPLQAILRTALDIHLMPFEQYRGQVGDYANHKLWIGISTLTVRHVTTDPKLSARYAVVSTPDSERRSVPTAALCAMFGISGTTAWRRCKALEAAGRITYRDDGWMIRKDQLRKADMEASVVGAVQFYLRRIGHLMTLGLNPAALHYYNGRPPLLPY